MSNRTIVEINHDYTSRIASSEEFLSLLYDALRGGSDRDWEPLREFGIRRAIMAHHSDKRHVVVNGRAYAFPGDLPPAEPSRTSRA